MAVGQLDTRVVPQLPRQKFQRPVATFPSIVLRYVIQVRQQLLFNVRRHFAWCSAGALIIDRVLTQFLVAVHRAIDRRAYAADHPCNLRHTNLVMKQKHDAGSMNLENTSALASYPQKLPTLRARQVNFYAHV